MFWGYTSYFSLWWYLHIDNSTVTKCSWTLDRIVLKFASFARHFISLLFNFRFSIKVFISYHILEHVIFILKRNPITNNFTLHYLSFSSFYKNQVSHISISCVRVKKNPSELTISLNFSGGTRTSFPFCEMIRHSLSMRSRLKMFDFLLIQETYILLLVSQTV